METPKIALTVDYKEIELRILGFMGTCIGYIDLDYTGVCEHYVKQSGRCSYFLNMLCDDVIVKKEKQ